MTAVPCVTGPPVPLQPYWSKMPVPLSWTPVVEVVLPVSVFP